MQKSNQNQIKYGTSVTSVVKSGLAFSTHSNPCLCCSCPTAFMKNQDKYTVKTVHACNEHIYKYQCKLLHLLVVMLSCFILYLMKEKRKSLLFIERI